MSRLRSAVQKGKRAAPENTEVIKSSNKKKSKPAIKEEEPSETEPSSAYHFFCDPTEIPFFRSHLLQWYDQNKRELPWRTLVTGAVDGNVIRVLCRVRAIGADSTSPAVTDALWKIADTLVDPERPGDFNQAMMELGARVCTPKSPLCGQCPVQTHCHAFKKVSIKQEIESKRLLSKLVSKLNTSVPDIDNCLAPGSCDLCLSEDWDPQLGVQNYPRKPVKKAPRVEQTLTCIVERQRAGEEMEYLLTQSPSKELLAGMWELPSMLLESHVSENKYKGLICDMMQKLLETSLDANSVQFVGEVVHIFSHIHQTYIVFFVCVSDWSEGEQEQKTCWLTKSVLKEAAVSTGVKKIMKLYESSSKVDSKEKKRKPSLEKRSSKTKRPKGDVTNEGPKQLCISKFFSKTAKS